MLQKQYDVAIINEQSTTFIDEYFNVDYQKVLHNVDTLAFCCFTDIPYNTLHTMLSYLDKQLQLAVSSQEDILLDSCDYYLKPYGISRYAYMLESKDRYDIFMSKHQSRITDVPIILKVKSCMLWMYGEKECVRMILEEFNQFLSIFGAHLLHIKLNRIDYAFHTNMIQNLDEYFKDADEMIVSQFRNYAKYYKSLPDLPAELSTFYHGNRKGKTVFMRFYDKTRETVEKGYKQFFYPIWYENGLISKYDKYVLEKSFEDRNFERHYLARLAFYNEYGTNHNLKVRCHFFLNPSNSYEFKSLYLFANQITPPLTRIINAEFEVGSKFHKSCNDFFLTLPDLPNIPPGMQTFYKMIFHKAFILDYLTHYCYRLVDPTQTIRRKDRDYNALWQQIRSCPDFSNPLDGKLLRTYQRHADLALLHKQIGQKIATVSLLQKGVNNDDILSDVADYINQLSENDLRNLALYKTYKGRLIKNQLN